MAYVAVFADQVGSWSWYPGNDVAETRPAIGAALGASSGGVGDGVPNRGVYWSVATTLQRRQPASISPGPGDRNPPKGRVPQQHSAREKQLARHGSRVGLA